MEKYKMRDCSLAPAISVSTDDLEEKTRLTWNQRVGAIAIPALKPWAHLPDEMSKTELEALLRNLIKPARRIKRVCEELLKSALSPDQVWVIILTKEQKMYGRVNSAGKIICYPANRPEPYKNIAPR